MRHCDCGHKLPMHLAPFMTAGCAHICICERRYVSNGKTFIRAGTAPNPHNKKRRVKP